MRDPILTPCEGTGCQTHFPRLCAMCGMAVFIDEERKALPHMRNDVIAMLERGDFDAAPTE